MRWAARVEGTRVAVVGPRLAEGVWDQQGRQSDHWQTLRPHIRAEINLMNGGEQSRLCDLGLQQGGNKASNL